jgi:hypothetical protein
LGSITEAKTVECVAGQTMVAVTDVKTIAQGDQVITFNSRLSYSDGIIILSFGLRVIYSIMYFLPYRTLYTRNRKN